MIDQYVHRLDRALRGPTRCKADLLTEARHGLRDAAEGYRDAGLSGVEAERRAVAEFGTVPELAAAYQAELAAMTTRRLAVRTVGVWLVLLALADRMWQGAPWSGSPPSAGYRLLSASLTWIWLAAAVCAAAAYLYLVWVARRGRSGEMRVSRAFGRALTGTLLVCALTGAGLFVWSFLLWDAARTWPPMLVGMTGIALAYAWLARTARHCLISTGGALIPTGGAAGRVSTGGAADRADLVSD